jgi:1-aminocyclopropane-1-carboxylate deaminase/D-cysteine desulfhydrase-like pyridoxal-dependent ACC family enzyme
LAELESQIRHAPLGVLPTPVENHRDLGRRIGIESLWIKHDDRIATPYAGGKIRKLEFFLADARHLGHRCVVTSGAVGSNHAVATAIFARRLGLDCHLLLMHGPRSAATRRNLLADANHGATLELVSGPNGVATTTARLQASDDPPYVIPSGGTAPLGNLGYVNAAFELEHQVSSGSMPPPDAVFVALGTMGTAVGLTLGLELSTLPTRVVGVRASNVPTSTRERFLEEFAATCAWLQERGVPIGEPSPERFRIEGGYLGRGYGYPTDAGRAAQRVAGEYDLELEATYTAKTFAAIVGSARELRTRTVLFWHTHSALEPPIGDTTARQLPSEFRGYFPKEKS